MSLIVKGESSCYFLSFNMISSLVSSRSFCIYLSYSRIYTYEWFIDNLFQMCRYLPMSISFGIQSLVAVLLHYPSSCLDLLFLHYFTWLVHLLLENKLAKIRINRVMGSSVFYLIKFGFGLFHILKQLCNILVRLDILHSIDLLL